MDIEQMTRGQIEAEFAALARTMYFTKSTIAAFSKDAQKLGLRHSKLYYSK